MRKTHLIKLQNEFLIGITFMGTMFGMSHLLARVFASLLYKDYAQKSIIENHLIIKNNNGVLEEFKNHEIQKIKFYYSGDLRWKATNPDFRK